MESVDRAKAEWEEFRRRKDAFFARGPHSPLTAEQQRHFRGLDYFPFNPDLRIEAPLEELTDRAEIALETSTGEIQVYRPAGVVRFSVEGQPAQVSLFASSAGAELFLPFRDATSGTESYGAGRYLEVNPPEHGRVVVDFNYAYNPYCAYNPHWSCPLPPPENWLRVPIRAGEKDFPGQSQH